MPHIDSPLQEPHPRHASATIVTTEREYIPPKPPTRNILPRGSPHKRTPIGHHAGGSAVWDRPSCLALPRATQQTTQKPASAPPRTCRTAPNVLLHVEDLPRTSLSAGRRRATLIRQAAPSPRAKATIGAMRGAWRVAAVWVLSCMGSEHAHCLRNAQTLSTGRV